MEEKWRYLPFVLTSILSFLIGFDIYGARGFIEGFLHHDISGIMELLISFLLMGIFFLLLSFMYVLKQGFDFSFLSKSFVISALTITILFLIFFTISATRSQVYLRVERIECDQYLNVTEAEIKECPELWKAVQYLLSTNETCYHAEISAKEGKEVKKFLEKRGDYISFNGMCIRVSLTYAD
ncbi:MAG TPA: hypothetical protein ENJ70_01110 [Thermoplasmatales archaeon]|nr:hypothetical protein [Thermoplasmatales archaeon]